MQTSGIGIWTGSHRSLPRLAMFTKALPSPAADEQRSNLPHSTASRIFAAILLRGYCRSDGSKTSAATNPALTPLEACYNLCNPTGNHLVSKDTNFENTPEGTPIYTFWRRVRADVQTSGELVRAISNLPTYPLEKATTARFAVLRMMISICSCSL